MNCTVVSFLPWQLRETKPGMIPNEFIVPKREGKIPGTLKVVDCIAMVDIGLDRPAFKSPVPAEQLAESIVRDATSSLLEYDLDTKPAVFYVQGEFSGEEVLKKFPELCAEQLNAQNRWWLKLVKVADDLWARFHQHKMISDLQRHAARELGLNGKEWAMEPEPVTLVKCFACKTMIESDAIICSSCNTVQPSKTEEAKKLGIGIKVA